jgi:serine/threonine protein kinase
MADDRGPKAEGERLVTPEFAPTERADVSGDRTRTGPRVVERHAERQPRAVGRFRIDAQLGSGGMGDVFRAYDTVLDRAVALKVLHTDRAADDGQRMRRVVREARAAAALVHPNAVTVFDVGEADSEVFIAMELLQGEDLRSVLERGDATTPDKLRWLLEAARALAAAHERGLVHRDVKPENMFVCKGGTLKLLDFGIAKRDDDESLHVDAAALSVGPSSLRTIEGRRVGTPRYMAPEQHAGEATDARTDEYAWGLVAFELLTGTHLVSDLPTLTRDGGAAAAHAPPSGERLAAMRAAVPDVPDATLQAIARALEPRKEARFPSMAPIIEALEKPADPPSTPRLEPPPSVPASTRTSAPRRSLVALVALGLVAVSAGAFVLSRPKAVVPVPPPPQACRLESTRTFAVSPKDRVTLLPTGELVVTRDIGGGLDPLRESPDGGLAPFMQATTFKALGNAYEDVGLRGLAFDDQPALLTEILQGDRGAAFSLSTEKQFVSTRRIFGNVVGTAAALYAKEVVVVVALRPTLASPDGPRGIQAFVLGAQVPRPTVIEEGIAGAPAVGTKDDRIAVAYTLGGELHFALLDSKLQRLGDVMKVASNDPSPAVAFAGEAVALFWTDGSGGKTRLTSATFTPGEAAFSAPKVASDEPLSPRAPVTAQLADGSWTVAWVTSTKGRSALRVARVGAGATLVGPGEITTSAGIDGLQARPTARGIDYWWQEDDRTVRIVRVSCTPP